MFQLLIKANLFLFLLILFSPIKVVAAEQETDISDGTLVDRTHQQISESLAAPSRWFDKFFIDPRVDEELAGTQLRIRVSTIYEEGEGFNFQGKGKARLRLPNLKRRYHLILSSEEDDLRDEILKDARSNGVLAEQEETTLALQYTQEDARELSLTHRLALNVEDGFNPQLRSRVRYSFPIAGKAILSLTQAGFWEKDDGFGEETRIDWDRPLNRTTLLRATGRGLFSESSNGYEWLTMGQWLQSFSQKRALAIGAFTAGETRPQNHVTEYDLFFRYRQRAVKDWLYFEIKPEVSWPREKNFSATGLLTLTMEIIFED